LLVVNGGNKLKISYGENFLDITKWRLTPYQVLVLGFASIILFGAFLLMTPLASSTGTATPFIDASLLFEEGLRKEYNPPC
jgi:hypothetical protein